MIQNVSSALDPRRLFQIVASKVSLEVFDERSDKPLGKRKLSRLFFILTQLL